MEGKEPVTATDPLTAALAVVVDNRALDADFAATLAANDIWVPVRLSDQGAMALTILNVDDAPFVAAFTSRELLDAAAPGATSIAQSYEWVASNLPVDAGIVFNPGQVPSLAMSNADAKALVSEERVIRAGETVRMGHPAIEPTELLERVAHALGNQPAVLEARRVWSQIGERPPGLVIGLSFADRADATDRKLAFRAVGESAAAAAPEFSVDLVELAGVDGFAVWMLENDEPFFSRQDQ